MWHHRGLNFQNCQGEFSDRVEMHIMTIILVMRNHCSGDFWNNNTGPLISTLSNSHLYFHFGLQLQSSDWDLSVCAPCFLSLDDEAFFSPKQCLSASCTIPTDRAHRYQPLVLARRSPSNSDLIEKNKTKQKKHCLSYLGREWRAVVVYRLSAPPASKFFPSPTSVPSFNTETCRDEWRLGRVHL